MCIQITERYAVCGCLYYKHAVDWCSAINTRGHTTQKKEVPVGNACSQHSSNEPDESPRGQVAQHIDPYGSPVADPLTRLSVSEQIGKSDPRLVSIYCNLKLLLRSLAAPSKVIDNR